MIRMNPHSLWTLLFALVLYGCAGPSANRLPQWMDADMRDIPKPTPVEEFQKWDFIDHSLFYPLGTLLDLEWTALRVAGRLGVGQGKQADNLNALDEAPNSSWFTNRHFHHRMSPEAVAEGPGSSQPDTSGIWRVKSGKTVGLTPGFTIVDPLGKRYIIKFEVGQWPEMSSSAEAISTRIFHAAGYNVPQNSVIFFRPEQLTLAPDAVLRFPDGTRRPLTADDLKHILKAVDPRPDGRLRALSSAYLDGEPLGPPGFHGRRRDDPNDRVLHEHRRELRGMRVISSWLHDTDRRTANMLDLYVSGERGNRFVRHYVIDFGSTLGSNNRTPHAPHYGIDYLWDPGSMAKSLLTLGFRSRDVAVPTILPYPSIGYYDNGSFSPGGWVTSYPNAAFLWRTDRDGYWGAKIVMSFTDADIAAVVKTGRLLDPDAEAELRRLMIELRDMIGRYWFERVNPLDHFRVEGRSLVFEDLAVTGGIEERPNSRYRAALRAEDERPQGPEQVMESTSVPLDGLAPDRYYVCDLWTERPTNGWSDRTRVRFYLGKDGAGAVVGIGRED